jgi:hypothetical protein
MQKRSTSIAKIRSLTNDSRRCRYGRCWRRAQVPAVVKTEVVKVSELVPVSVLPTALSDHPNNDPEII